MNIIFVGGFFLKTDMHEILKKSKLQVQNAANNFQWGIIHGIEKNLSASITLISAPFIGWYPKYYTDFIIQSTDQVRGREGAACVSVGFLNIPVIKNIFKYFNLRKRLNDSLLPQTDTVIIVYSLETAYLKAALKVKKRNPGITVCVIVTDLHEFPGDAGFLYLLYVKYIEKPIFYKLLSDIDCFVVLTDKMVDFLQIKEKPWVRIEGLFAVEDTAYQASCKADAEVNVILFTGTLDYRYGLNELLDAFRLIKDASYSLWICGGGPCERLVKERALVDTRIRYFGLVSRVVVADLQRRATILVNPRNNTSDFNKYSFPSKIIEYFVSGTPSLMYRLDGIPVEYFDYCFTVNKDGVENLASALYEVCSLDKNILKSKGIAARNFILNSKTAEIQCKKILTMLSKFNLDRK